MNGALLVRVDESSALRTGASGVMGGGGVFVQAADFEWLKLAFTADARGWRHVSAGRVGQSIPVGEALSEPLFERLHTVEATAGVHLAPGLTGPVGIYASLAYRFAQSMHADGPSGLTLFPLTGAVCCEGSPC